jgi:hypothetical protein
MSLTSQTARWQPSSGSLGRPVVEKSRPGMGLALSGLLDLEIGVVEGHQAQQQTLLVPAAPEVLAGTSS